MGLILMRFVRCGKNKIKPVFSGGRGETSAIGALLGEEHPCRE